MNTSPSPHSLRPLRAAAPRFKRLAPLLAAIIFAFSDPRSALAWETPAESLLAVSPDPRSLRTALAALAKSAAARDPRLSSEALYWRGVSAAREGKADSAIASLERAGRIFPFDDQQLALADAWMARGHPADLAAAAQLMHDAAPFADVNQDRVPFRARLGWALFLAGQADSAVNVFAPINHYLNQELLWRERIGRAAEAAKKSRIATDMLMTVVIETRGADRPALEALHRSLGPNQEKRIADLDAYLKQKIAEQEAVDRRTVEAFGAHRLHLPASDGFLLGAALNVLVPGSPVAVVLMSTGDSLGVYDSLATRFADSGFATLLIERRGSGGSVGPEVAVAGDTYGRQEALENRIARDAFDALRAAARLIQLDTTRVVLVGVRDSAPTAIRAMTLSPRARGLVLISPKPILIELGASRARLAKARRPLFIQLAIDEGYMFHSSDIYMDALYRASDASRSRVVEARMVGGGPTLFRRDPTLWERIDQWLTGALSAPTSTRPPASRKG